MAPNNTPLGAQFLRELALAETSYRDYMQHGKSFNFASQIRGHNAALLNILLSDLSGLPDDIRPHAESHILHLESWLELWDSHKVATSPSPDDAFVFPTRVPMPKASVLVLADWYGKTL